MYRGRELRTVEEASEAGAMLELSHDQNGCRFLQDQLDLKHAPHIALIFEAVKTDTVALATDPFGNYLIQKLLQYGTPDQRMELIALSADHMVPVALNVHGTRVVQKMVEMADTREQRCTHATNTLRAISEQPPSNLRETSEQHPRNFRATSEHPPSTPLTPPNTSLTPLIPLHPAPNTLP